MNTKLTLKLDSAVIERAKEYAELRGSSVSQLVEDYFIRIDEVSVSKKKGTKAGSKSTSITTRLRGLISDSNIDKTVYHEHLVQKYR